MVGRALAVAVLASLLLAGLSALPGPRNASAAPVPAALGPPTIFVNITTTDLAFSPAEFTAPPNASVRVRITQGDPVPHTFTVSATADDVLDSGLTPAQLDAYFVDNNLTDVEIPDVVGAVVWANFTAPAERGRYEFACTVAGHFQNGMFGFMTVAQADVFVNMTTDGLMFGPDLIVAPPNANVYVRITQRDAVEHTFTLGTERDVTLASNLTPAQLSAYFVDNNITDVVIPDAIGTVVWANFTAPSEPGRYEFVCLTPGHFQAGMIGFLLVTESGPPVTDGPPIGIVAAIMIGTVVFALLFAAGYHVRAVRAHRRMRSR